MAPGKQITFWWMISYPRVNGHLKPDLVGGGGGDTKLRVIGLCGSIWEEMGDEGE